MSTYLWYILILSGIGILNTVYLTSHVFSKTMVKCLFFPKAWCRKVQFSKYSKTFGIPNPIAGLGMYLVIFILTLLFANGTLMTFTSISIFIWIGFLFSIYFTFIQAFVLRAFCTWCVLSAVDFTLLFLVNLLMR